MLAALACGFIGSVRFKAGWFGENMTELNRDLDLDGD
jgi:hypothetical protein